VFIVASSVNTFLLLALKILIYHLMILKTERFCGDKYMKHMTCFILIFQWEDKILMDVLRSRI